MTTRRLTLVALALPVLVLPACGSKDPSPDAGYVPQNSYIDDLDKKDERAAAATPAPEPEPEPAAAPEPAPEPPAETPDEAPERELTAQRKSRSIYGKTRDMARDLRPGLQGAATPTGDIALTTDQDMWIEVGNLHWDAPLDWQLVIPGDPSIKGELHVPSPLGDAQILFREDPRPANAIVRDVGVRVVDDIAEPIRPTDRKSQIAGHTVHRFSMSGTVVPPTGNDLPFWKVHAVVVERPEHPCVVILFMGPSQTVEQNEPRWDAMIEGMTAK